MCMVYLLYIQNVIKYEMENSHNHKCHQDIKYILIVM